MLMSAGLPTSTAPLLLPVLVAEAIALLLPLAKAFVLDALLEVPPVLAALDAASVRLASAAATVTVM